jgi:hypothetical protein
MNPNKSKGFFLAHRREVFITVMNIDDLFDGFSYEPLIFPPVQMLYNNSQAIFFVADLSKYMDEGVPDPRGLVVLKLI